MYVLIVQYVEHFSFSSDEINPIWTLSKINGLLTVAKSQTWAKRAVKLAR